MISVTFLRKFLFYIFALIYAVLCPVLILYSFGYILRPGTIDELTETGSIHLSSQPSGATVYLGNRRLTDKTPATLQELLPGDYNVKISLAGYQPWELTVSVRAQKVVVFDHIVLIPNNRGQILSNKKPRFFKKEKQI